MKNIHPLEDFLTDISLHPTWLRLIRLSVNRNIYERKRLCYNGVEIKSYHHPTNKSSKPIVVGKKVKEPFSKKKHSSFFSSQCTLSNSPLYQGGCKQYVVEGWVGKSH